MKLAEISSTPLTDSESCGSTRQLMLMWLNSQDGSSEEFIGEWMEKRGNREQIVLATKVSDVVFSQSLFFTILTHI